MFPFQISESDLFLYAVQCDSRASFSFQIKLIFPSQKKKRKENLCQDRARGGSVDFGCETNVRNL